MAYQIGLEPTHRISTITHSLANYSLANQGYWYIFKLIMVRQVRNRTHIYITTHTQTFQLMYASIKSSSSTPHNFTTPTCSYLIYNDHLSLFAVSKHYLVVWLGGLLLSFLKKNSALSLVPKTNWNNCFCPSFSSSLKDDTKTIKISCV